MPVDRWEPQRVIGEAKAEIVRRMRRATEVVRDDVQRRLGKGQPPGVVVKRGPSGGQYASGRKPGIGVGEAPRILTGNLRKSITTDVKDEGNRVVGRVGSNLPYARRQELGFFGTDSRGRNINQGERPYLRPALFENLTRLGNIIGGG